MLPAASIAVAAGAGALYAGPGRGRAVGIVATGYPVGAALTIWLGAAWIDAGGSYAALWAILGGSLTGPVAARQSVAQPDIRRQLEPCWR